MGHLSTVLAKLLWHRSECHHMLVWQQGQQPLNDSTLPFLLFVVHELVLNQPDTAFDEPILECLELEDQEAGCHAFDAASPLSTSCHVQGT